MFGAQQRNDRSLQRALIVLAVVLAALYLWVAFLSDRFQYTSPAGQRPLLSVLGIFASCFVLHLIGLAIGLKASDQKLTTRTVVISAVGFRVILLFSAPIQEVDVYRYVWDGAVLCEGVSPFRYSPHRVVQADLREDGLTAELQRLVQLRDREPGLAEALQRVHYAEMTTIYPPVSQIFFGLADLVTPAGASCEMRVVVMKFVIVCLDLGILALLLRLLSRFQMHSAWSITYAWSPLVLKEFANSGHLDSIAVFFTVASLAASVRSSAERCDKTNSWNLGAAVFLSLGIGAKLFPVVLAPLLVLPTYKQNGWWSATRQAAWIVLLTSALLSPMAIGILHPPADARLAAEIVLEENVPPLPAFTDPAESQDLDQIPTQVLGKASRESAAEGSIQIAPVPSGLTTFLARWEMNDLLFMLVEENLRPKAAGESPWFVVTSSAFRQSVTKQAGFILSVDESRIPFLVTRWITLGVFALIAAGLAGRVIWKPGGMWKPDDLSRQKRQLEAAFLTLAWFWLLAPTQNPWYWTWAVPLISFARGKAWLALSGLVFVYYLRFWFLYHFTGIDVATSGYEGTAFFDYVVVWLEFGPWLLVLLGLAIRRRFCMAA